LAQGELSDPRWQFDACYQLPKILLEKFDEHEKPSGRFFTFDRFLAASRMTETVQDKLHRARFAALDGTTDGVKLAEGWEQWGNARRKQYLARHRNELPMVETLMLQSDFEKLIEREPPFDGCTADDVKSCLEYLRDRCVRERGFCLVLVDDKRLQKHPDLEFRLKPLEAVGVIGKNFTYRKYTDTYVTWSENKVDVDATLNMLKRLQRLVPDATDEKRIVRQLEGYQRSLKPRRE
jgi:hypothetical protein